MHNVKLGLIWAAAIILAALVGNGIGIEKQLSSILVTGLGILAVIHIGRSQPQQKNCK